MDEKKSFEFIQHIQIQDLSLKASNARMVMVLLLLLLCFISEGIVNAVLRCADLQIALLS